MKDRSKTGVQILQVAAGIGVLADILLRQTPWGLNVLLFNLAFVGATTVLLWHRKREYLTPQTWALLGAQVYFAAMFVWRDSMELRMADSVAIVAMMSVLLVPQMKIPPRVAGVFHYAIGFLWSTLNAFFGSFVLLFSDVTWSNSNLSGWKKNAVAIIRGLLIVSPLILIFGGLFVAADAAYEGLVNRLLNFDLSRVFSHAIITAIFAWATAGYLRSILLGRAPGFAAGTTAAESVSSDDKKTDTQANTAADNDPVDLTGGNATVRERASHTSSKVDALKTDSGEYPVALPDNATILEHINRSDEPNRKEESQPSENASSAQAETRAAWSVPDPTKASQKTPWTWSNIDNGLIPNAFTLGTVEIGVVLGLIDLLFLSFVIVQIPYLFGGMDLVQSTPDFKLAEYARRGFGELVAVSALVLPVLLISHWLVRKKNPFTEKLFRALAAIQTVLLFVIMASAVQRLVLLTGNLGYGMTTVRLYPMIFMTWLAVVFVWFALTVLRGYRQYFAWGALWLAIFILGATHFLNPDEFIVKTNLALMRQGREFDAVYNSQLSDDAIPTLIGSFAELSNEDQQKALRTLTQSYCRHSFAWELRSFNISRERANRSFSLVAPFAPCGPVKTVDEEGF